MLIHKMTTCIASRNIWHTWWRAHGGEKVNLRKDNTVLYTDEVIDDLLGERLAFWHEA